jgi:hypothetical protein
MRMVFPGGAREAIARLGGLLIGRHFSKIRKHVNRYHVPVLAALVCFALLGGVSTPAFSQTGAPKASEKPGKDGNGATADQREAREFAEAARALKGAAGNPECVWLGRRIIALLLRDDLDTAFRHLELYGRFGCPRSQIQNSFRCLIRQGTRIDPKADPKIFEKLDARTLACWIKPDDRPSAKPTDAEGSVRPSSK